VACLWMGSPIEGWTRQSAVKCAVNYSSGRTIKLEHEAAFPVITVKPKKKDASSSKSTAFHSLCLGFKSRPDTEYIHCRCPFFNSDFL